MNVINAETGFQASQSVIRSSADEIVLRRVFALSLDPRIKRFKGRGRRYITKKYKNLFNLCLVMKVHFVSRISPRHQTSIVAQRQARTMLIARLRACPQLSHHYCRTDVSLHYFNVCSIVIIQNNLFCGQILGDVAVLRSKNR